MRQVYREAMAEVGLPSIPEPDRGTVTVAEARSVIASAEGGQGKSERVRAKGSPRPKRAVTVRPLARPEIDAKRLARVLVDLAREDERSGGELLKKLQRRGRKL